MLRFVWLWLDAGRKIKMNIKVSEIKQLIFKHSLIFGVSELTQMLQGKQNRASEKDRDVEIERKMICLATGTRASSMWGHCGPAYSFIWSIDHVRPGGPSVFRNR